jgi:predicted amidohydrolase YtcJ
VLKPQRTNLRDAHLHLAEYGESLGLVALGDCTSIDDVLQKIAAASEVLSPGKWVRAAGLRIQGLAERRPPTAAELHEASDGRCVLARSFDHHAVCVSTKALQAASIDAHTPDPVGGVIVRDGAGNPTGLLLEHACDAVWRAVPPTSDDEYRGWVVAGLDDLSRRGIVEVHDMFARERFVHTLQQLERERVLTTEVWLYATPEHFESVRSACADTPSELVRFAGLKLFADGTLNSRTASMLTDYADPIPGSPRGTPLLNQAEIEADLRKARAAGVGMAVHAIGDAAVRTVLDAVEACGGGTDPSSVPALDAVRIEHAQFVDGADIPRFAQLGVVASPQPCHLLTDIEAIERLMPHRAERAFPLRDLCNAYAQQGMDPAQWVWLGSDAPVVPPDPFDNITAATLRTRGTRPDQPLGGRIAPDQALDEALTWSLMQSRSRTLSP